MNSLTLTTQRRLKKLPQQPSVWEGDRRSLATTTSDSPANSEQCVIWVDRSEGSVRAMEIVPSDLGPEAIVRTLIRAMETPMGAIRPSRPQKILVRNREVQFFLRGALQSLNIIVEYEPELPLIEEIFRTLAESQVGRPPALPPRYNSSIQELAQELWQEAPWEYIADHEIISLDLKEIHSETIYLCVLGMSEQEYGLILYRSLDSLKRFRQAALEQEESLNNLEQIFLSQDCWFVNYEALEDWDFEDDEDIDIGDLDSHEVEAILGSIHPYEGLRRFLDEDEASVIYLSLQALLRFLRSSHRQLEKETVPFLTKTYSLPPSPLSENQPIVSVTISTQPEISLELLEMMENDEDEKDEENTLNIPINGDLIPDNSLISLDVVSREFITKLLDNPKTYSAAFTATSLGEFLPVILIQTTRPKAKEIIQVLEATGGLKSVCLHRVESFDLGFERELGLLQTNNGNIYLFDEFDLEDPKYKKLRQKWSLACQQTQGYCALIVAMGVSGSASGKPELKDMLAIFKARFLDDLKEIMQ